MMKIKYSISTLALLLSFNLNAFAAEPTLTIQSSTDKKVYKLSALLKRKDVETLTINYDPSYPKQERKYKAVKAATLFEGITIAEDAAIQFKALDGFSAPLSKQRLLNQSAEGAIAYIAIEPPNAKWPGLKKDKPSAGPFYLIWKNPGLSKVGPEEWPYMLAGFEIKESLEALYPKILPNKDVAKTDPVYLGFQVFTKNCFACHTLNKSGTSQMGPDLNMPMNPTEYLQESAMRKLIRNPQNLRSWPQSKMNGFNEETLSNDDLDHVIAYLRHMAKNRKNEP